MNRNILVIFFSTITSVIYAQKNFIDQPFIEITAKSDTLVAPDRVFISININETDSKNKKSVEEQEKTLETTLKNLNIDTEKDLSLLDFSSAFKNYFLNSKSIVKSKMYSLLVSDAIIASKVLSELENSGISNVKIERTEYSNAEILLLELKSQAVKKSLSTAEALTKPLNQKVGKALYISDINTLSNGAPGVQIRGMTSIYGSRTAEPIYIEFQKIKFEVQVNVKYSLE